MSQVSLSAPKSLGLQVFSRGVEGGEAPSSDGRSNWAWSYKNLQMATPEAGAVSPVDYGPLIVATTFKDYGALAAAYDARAKTKATQTDRHQKAGERSDAERAYAARTGQGALRLGGAEYQVRRQLRWRHGSVVPHDADVVLANRMGDCKDHTTLLQALLAVKGIASTPTLINSDDAYTLPEAPCIEAFNHVITYIPSLDLYADSTSPLHVVRGIADRGMRASLSSRPSTTRVSNTPRCRNGRTTAMISTTVMKINADGSAEGETQNPFEGRNGRPDDGTG